MSTLLFATMYHADTKYCLHRSEATHTALVCLAANVLYDAPAAQPEPAACAGASVAQTQDADGEEHQSASDNEDAASFNSAIPDLEEAAAENQVAQPPYS